MPDSVNGLPDNPLLNVYFLDQKQKQSKKEGLRIAQTIYQQQVSGGDSLNFWRARNARWIELLLWAKGSQDMREFLDYMSVSDGNKSYIKIDMTQPRVGAQFVGTLVESMAKNVIIPCVDAVDDGSVSEKQQRMMDALYRMKDKETIQGYEQAAGIPFEAPDAYVPKDELSAKVYFELEDRLPKEIRFEKRLQKILDDIQFNRVINRKGIYDMVTLNFEATKIEKLSPGNYTVRKCVAPNCTYNFIINDTGYCELSQFGEFYNVKVKDVRAKYGKSTENPEGLTERQIFDLVRTSTQKNKGVFNFFWDNSWGVDSYTLPRPYDAFSIYIYDFEIDCGEDMYFVEKKDAYGRPDIKVKKNRPYSQEGQEKPEDVTITKRKKNTWMRGVYAPYSDTMLYWGAPDIIITPYTNLYHSLSSYSVNIPNNDGEYVPSLFERCLEPLREYTIAKLKRKHLIAQIKPFGIRIDVESARNIDLGSGDSIPWEEVLRIYNQTGSEIYSSKGIDPLERQTPALSNTVADQTVQKIIEITNVMANILQEIRMLIGSSVYLEGGDLGDRTAAKLAEDQTKNASNVFGYVYNGHIQLWEETLYKLTCLYWNDVVKEEPESESDLLNTRFYTTIKMKLADYEKAQLEADIQLWGKMPDAFGNPVLGPKDAFRLRNIDNYKLAELYLANTWQENYDKAQQDKSRAEQANIESQRQTAELSAKAAKELQDQKLAAEQEFKIAEEKAKKETAIVTGTMEILKAVTSGGVMPMEFKPVIDAVIQNVLLPMVLETQELKQNVMMAAQQQMMQQQQPQGQMPPQEQPPQQGMPPIQQEQPQQPMQSQQIPMQNVQ